MEVNLALPVSIFSVAAPWLWRKATLAACATFVCEVLPDRRPAPAPVTPDELIPPVSSVPELAACPNSISSDCRPERKSRPSVAVAAVDEERTDAALPQASKLEGTPSALPVLCAAVAPVPISIPAAAVMQREKADSVPKRDSQGLEHCQEWNL